MSAVAVYKAQATLLGETVPDLLIEAGVPFPAHLGADEATDTHQANARVVVDALYASLPGGTLDQVLCLMLVRAASRLRVRHRLEIDDV